MGVPLLLTEDGSTIDTEVGFGLLCDGLWEIPLFVPSIGIMFPVTRTLIWSGINQEAVSGKTIDLSLYTYPRYGWEIQMSVLRTYFAQEFQYLLDFINGLNGGTSPFLYDDPNDDTVPNISSAITSDLFAVGDGVTQNFQLYRNVIDDGFSEPVFFLNGNPTVYLDGVVLTLGTDFTVAQGGIIQFAVAPALGAELSWSGKFYWMCKFDLGKTSFGKQTIPFGEFAKRMYEMKKLSFTSLKLP